MNKMEKALDEIVASKDENFLLDAYRRIAQRVKSLRSMQSLDAISQFKVGDSVKFYSKKMRSSASGTVMGLRTKKVEVQLETGTSWIVPASMLQKA